MSIFGVALHLNTEALKIFHIFSCPWCSITLSRCRRREAKNCRVTSSANNNIFKIHKTITFANAKFLPIFSRCSATLINSSSNWGKKEGMVKKEENLERFNLWSNSNCDFNGYRYILFLTGSHHRRRCFDWRCWRRWLAGDSCRSSRRALPPDILKKRKYGTFQFSRGNMALFKRKYGTLYEEIWHFIWGNMALLKRKKICFLTGMCICIHFLRIRVQLFCSMRIQIQLYKTVTYW